MGELVLVLFIFLTVLVLFCIPLTIIFWARAVYYKELWVQSQLRVDRYELYFAHNKLK